MESTPPNYNSISSSPKLIINDDEKTDQEGSPRRGFRWTPTSLKEFSNAEKKLMSYISIPYEIKCVPSGNITEPGSFCRSGKLRSVQISTAIVPPKTPSHSQKHPVVFIHGVIIAKATWSFLLNEVCQDRTLYAMDLPGYGLSSRIKFPKDPTQIEETYLNILERWRETLSLEKFILIGFSFGGFLASAYALQYPERVEHLVLIDPWGIPVKPDRVTNVIGQTNPVAIWLMDLYTKRINLMAAVRVLGPKGPGVSYQTFAREAKNFSVLGEGMDEAMRQYCYHCVAKKPTGETAFRFMTKCCLYARKPISLRLHLLNSCIPVSMFYPDEGTSYIPAIPDDALRSVLNPQCRLAIHKIPDTNHENIILSKELAALLGSILN